MPIDADAEIRYVVTHPRFRGLAPATPLGSPPPDVYVIRIDDGAGHVIEVRGRLPDVFFAAADALRRTQP